MGCRAKAVGRFRLHRLVTSIPLCDACARRRGAVEIERFNVQEDTVRKGSSLVVRNNHDNPRICRIEGCLSKAHARGLCKADYAAAKAAGRLEELGAPRIHGWGLPSRAELATTDVSLEPQPKRQRPTSPVKPSTIDSRDVELAQLRSQVKDLRDDLARATGLLETEKDTSESRRTVIGNLRRELAEVQALLEDWRTWAVDEDETRAGLDDDALRRGFDDHVAGLEHTVDDLKANQLDEEDLRRRVRALMAAEDLREGAELDELPSELQSPAVMGAVAALEAMAFGPRRAAA